MYICIYYVYIYIYILYVCRIRVCKKYLFVPSVRPLLLPRPIGHSDPKTWKENKEIALRSEPVENSECDFLLTHSKSAKHSPSTNKYSCPLHPDLLGFHLIFQNMQIQTMAKRARGPVAQSPLPRDFKDFNAMTFRSSSSKVSMNSSKRCL